MNTGTAPQRFNVLVVQDDPLLCAGLVAALREHNGLVVFVDGAEDGDHAAAPIDVVVADYPNAMRLARPAAPADPRLASARILALTSNDREGDIRKAIQAGVHGYVLLGGPLAELLDGVISVARGARYLGQPVAQRMADSLTRAALTSRETEVLGLLVAGESNKSIARHLDIELGTVKSHVSAIMTKLGASSRTQAAGIATTRGLVELRMASRPHVPTVSSALSYRPPPRLVHAA